MLTEEARWNRRREQVLRKGDPGIATHKRDRCEITFHHGQDIEVYDVCEGVEEMEELEDIFVHREEMLRIWDDLGDLYPSAPDTE